MMLALFLALAALPGVRDPQSRPPGTIQAVRVASAIVLDGDLADAVWQTAVPIEQFTQRDPREGQPATQRTVVRVAFDESAFYVGAVLYDTAPDSIHALLARRDRYVNADRFTVFLDPYHDKRTGFYFAVNAAGTLYDGTLYNDDWDNDTWDGVWEAKTRRTAEGWAVEMRIPFSQLRFQKADDYIWGINFKREIARNNERDYIAYTPRNSSGFVSRFIELTGLSGITPPKRLEVLPYVTSKMEFLDHGAGDPFNDGSRFVSAAGADLKFGIGGNLTVDATVNPDFGQVEVDPAVVNLSDVETFFNEKRPFFIEGANIFNNFGQGGSNDFWGFNWSGVDMLYTRRVGRSPQISIDQPDGGYLKTPSGTHILGATKLTGKIGSWSLATLGAFTRREHATVADAAGLRSRPEVEPFTYYGVARTLKEFGAGRQGLGLMSTATIRSFDDPTLRNDLSSSAFALGLDGWTFLDRDKVWVVTGYTSLSRVAGTAARITDLQQNSVHYFQRPDATTVSVDSTATTLSGMAGRFTLNKQKGRLFVNSAVGFISPGFEANDLGFQSRSDVVNAHQVVGYRWRTPTRLYREVRWNVSHFRSWNFDGDPVWTGYWTNVNTQLRNFYWVYSSIAYNPQTLSPRRTRGGPLTLNPSGFEWNGGFDSDDRHPVLFGMNTWTTQYRFDSDHTWNISGYVEWKPMDRLSVRLEPGYERSHTNAQYVDTFDDPTATATFGHRYVFGDLRQTTLSASLRLNWIFSPRLSLEVYAQPLVSSGHYTSFKELARPGSYDFNAYGENGSTFDPATLTADPDGPGGPAAPLTIEDPNFTVASLRGNAVMRWEYLPGSTLFLVWTQNRKDDEDLGTFRLGHSLGRMFSAKADNIFLVKVSYWWNP